MKVLVTDFDKTFYKDNEDIEINKALVNEFRKKGNLLIFATGRSKFSFNRQINKFNLKYDYLILNHGSVIVDKDWNTLFYSTLDSNIIDLVKPYLRIEDSISFYYCSLDKDKLDSGENIVKIHIKYNNYNALKEVHDQIKDMFGTIVNVFMASKRTLEIVSKSSSKLKGIKYLVNELKLEENNIYTIGDGESDIEMIKEYNGRAMNDSIDELRNSNYKKCDTVSELIKEIL